METQAFHALEYEGEDYDCGSKIGYFEANLAHAIDNPEIGEEARALLQKWCDKETRFN